MKFSSLNFFIFMSILAHFSRNKADSSLDFKPANSCSTVASCQQLLFSELLFSLIKPQNRSSCSKLPGLLSYAFSPENFYGDVIPYVFLEIPSPPELGQLCTDVLCAHSTDTAQHSTLRNSSSHMCLSGQIIQNFKSLR